MNTSTSSQQTLPLSHVPMKSQYYNMDNSRHSHSNPNGHTNRYPNGDDGNAANYYQSRNVPRSTYADRTYSLPRTAAAPSSVAAPSHRHSQQPVAHHEGYYTQDRRSRHPRNSHHAPNHYNDESHLNLDKPDHYFMPSQRKYSGEVVRVYVDYNKDLKK